MKHVSTADYTRDKGSKWKRGYRHVTLTPTTPKDREDMLVMSTSPEAEESRKLREDTDTFIKEHADTDTMTTTDVEHEGLGELFGDDESPEPVEDTTPDEVVEIEKESVMSKLRGSVNVPEEFKFADHLTFFTMLRNIFRGKNISGHWTLRLW